MKLAFSINDDEFQNKVATTFSSNIINLILGVINGALIARMLGVSGKGELAVFFTLTGLGSAIFNLGIGQSNVYLMGSKQHGIDELTSNSIVLGIILAIIGDLIITMMMFTGLIHKIVPSLTNNAILLFMFYLPAALVNGYFSSILLGLQKIYLINFTKIVNSVIIIVLNMVFIVLDEFSVNHALFSIIIANLSVSAILIKNLKKEGGKFFLGISLEVFKSQLGFGIKSYVGNLLQFFNYRLDNFIINYFLGTGEVGIYSVSVTVAGLLWNLPDAIGFVIFPKAATSDTGELKNFTKKVFFVTMGLLLFGALGLFIFGPFLIRFIYSEEFVSAYQPMMILLPGVVLLGGSKVLSNEMAGRGYPQYNSWVALLSLFITIILDVILIPSKGISGAALASTISYSFSFFVAGGIYIWLDKSR